MCWPSLTERERGVLAGSSFDDRARKDLRRIDPPTRDRILRAIGRLAQGAELAGDIKRLRGSGEYRPRVGDWRVRLNATIASSRLVVVRVLPRGRAYVTVERSDLQALSA